MAIIAASPRGKAGSGRRVGWKRSRQILGLLYAMPTMIYVAVFFVLPVCLVFLMSSSSWSLLTGSKAINFPDNYSNVSAGALFWPAVWFWNWIAGDGQPGALPCWSWWAPSR